MLFPTLLLASTVSASCLHGLSMYKRAEGAVELPAFGYGAENGPFKWADLAVENEACRAGTTQSPINLDTTTAARASNPVVTRRQAVEGNEGGANGTAPSADRPVVDIPQQSVVFENLGTTIEVVMNGTTTFQGADFRLVQFHMHTPSEHHVDGEYFPLEVHMVHQAVGTSSPPPLSLEKKKNTQTNTPTADETQIAVMALLFQLSPSGSDPLIAGLTPSLPSIETPGSKVTIPAGVDFSSAMARMQSSDILQYSGSLTTPPCAEGVTFLVVKEPLALGVEDYNAIKKTVKFNARFIQNSLGGENMLAVGAKSGGAAAGNATAAA
jgi:carbonic anhydrase